MKVIISIIFTALSISLATASPVYASGLNVNCSELFQTNSKSIVFRDRYGIEYLITVRVDADDELAATIKRFADVRASGKYWLSQTEEFWATQARQKLEADEFSPRELSLHEGSALYSRELNQHTIADISIEEVSKSVGFGVFAKSKISKGVMIGEYTGILRSKGGSDANNDYLFATRYGRSFSLDARDAGNEIRFVNHSHLHANAVFLSVFHGGLWHVIIIADREIQAGEQILFDYGYEYWSTRNEPEDLNSR